MIQYMIVILLLCLFQLQKSEKVLSWMYHLCSLASHTLEMKTEGLVQYGYHTRPLLAAQPDFK